MGCASAKRAEVHQTTKLNQPDFFGNDRPDEEAVELSPPKVQEKKEDSNYIEVNQNIPIIRNRTVQNDIEIQDRKDPKADVIKEPASNVEANKEALSNIETNKEAPSNFEANKVAPSYVEANKEVASKAEANIEAASNAEANIEVVSHAEASISKPVFPNYEPKFDFEDPEEEPENKAESHRVEDINDLIQDINDI